MKKKVRLVGFDVNGTILDDTALFLDAINGIFPKFGKFKLLPDVLRAQFGQPWTKIYRDAGITEAMASETDLYEIYNALYRAGSPPKPFAGLKKTLEWLSKKRIDLAIISTQQNSITKPLLKLGGLDNFFLQVIGSVGDKAAALRQLYDVVGLTGDEVAYVGDQEGDVRHAKKAGCISIAFMGGLHAPERLKKARPDFLIQRHAEIKKLPIF